MWPNFATTLLVITLSGQAYAQAEFDEFTPCSVAARAFTSHDNVKIQRVSRFISQSLEHLDREHRQVGEVAILNDRLTPALVAATGGACAQHERSTISVETNNVYRGMRLLLQASAQF